ncbi:MAG: ABC transporter permease [Chloroflexi bacterium]|nr:ABC transporter permease [Chloroflexota bacterium]
MASETKLGVVEWPRWRAALQLSRGHLLRDLILLLVWIALLILFAYLSPFFFTTQNFINIGLAVTMIGIAAVGATLVLVSGGLDLTVGSVIGLSVITVGALLTLGLPVILAILGALMVGLLVGAINGFLVVKGRINPLIATLGMLSIIRGLAFVYSEGISHAIVSESYSFLARGRLAGIPAPIIFLLVIYVIAWAVMKYTDFGHYIYSMGGNSQACRLAGVDVDKLRYKVYIAGAGFSTLAGLFLASRMQAALPQAGNGSELTVIAAVILGGTSLSGGVGNVFGTLLGVLILGTLDNGFTLLNVPAFYQMIARGAVLVIAVFIDQLRTGGYE